MNSPPRFAWVIRILAGLAICVSLFWLWNVSPPWFSFFDTSQSDAGIPFRILMPIFMGLPAFFGLYFGYQGIRRTDAATIKGLVASYCVGLAYFLAVFLDIRMRTSSGLSEDFTLNLSAFLVSIIAVSIYWFTSRYLLRSLGHRCPTVRQSLPKWPIGLSAFFLLQATLSMVRDIVPVERRDGHIHIVCFIGAVVLAVSVFKLGVWLFAKQKPVAEPTVPANS